MRLGERVLVLIKEKNLSQKGLAEHLGVGTSTVSGWNKPNRNPSWDLIVPICEYIGVSEHFLLTGETELEDSEIDEIVEELSKDQRVLLRFYDSLSEEQQLDIINEVAAKVYAERNSAKPTVAVGQEAKLVSANKPSLPTAKVSKKKNA